MAHEHDPDEVAKPFDEFSSGTSRAAADLLWCLCGQRSADSPDQWSDADDKEFIAWKGLEHSFRLMPLPAELDVDEQLLQFHRHVDDFHAALPFHEEERSWLVGPTDVKVSTREYRRIADWHAHQEQRIMVAGIRQMVRGPELTQRWYDWRRERNDYSGQDALLVARTALWGLVQTLTPQASPSDAYEALLRGGKQPPTPEA